ncbi:MAG: hypothetical protein ACE3L7_13885 [Candidatus Pristimantibacillus sp.]
MVTHILSLVNKPAEVTVITFGEDISDGHHARHLYQKFGFLPQDDVIPNGPEGGSRHKFKLNIT